jgi:hypothetical protein
MSNVGKHISWPVSASLVAVLAIACSSVDEKPAPKPAPAVVAPAPKPAPAPAPAKAESAKTEAAKTAKTKALDVEGVISAVGQRTITFQMERKGKVREEVVGVDDKTKIEKSGSNVKLGDLQATDKGMINYEPDAYTPAIAIKITGKGEIQKIGGDD